MNTKTNQYFTCRHLKEVQLSPAADEAFVSKRSILAKISCPERILEIVGVDMLVGQVIVDQPQPHNRSVKLAHLDITNYVSRPNMVNTFNRHKYISYLL